MGDDHHAYEMAEEAECRMHANDELRHQLREELDEWKRMANEEHRDSRTAGTFDYCIRKLEAILNE